MAIEVLRTKEAVKYRDLREYIELLEGAGLLKRIKAEVDLKHEIGAICARSLDMKGPGLLFENVKGYPGMPLVANVTSTVDQLAVAFGAAPDEDKIYDALIQGIEHRIPSEIVSTGPCKEETFRGDEVDLYKFPTPWWHELDGGQYIGTTVGCITRDPNTGFLNMGAYRAMIRSKNTASCLMRGNHPVGGPARSSGRGGARDPGGPEHVLANEAMGRPTPIALALGMDPLLTLAAGTPIPVDTKGYAEFEGAGGWRGSPTQLVKAETSDLLVPAYAEVILEGEVVPGARVPEGPHGESTGFYSQGSGVFLVNIHCITQRHNPLSYGLITRLFYDYPTPIFRSGFYLSMIVQRSGLTNIKRAYLPEVGREAMIVIAAEITSPDQPRQIMEAVWEHTRLRWVIVVDEDCDIRNWDDVMWRVCAAAQAPNDVVQGKEFARQRHSSVTEFEPPTCGVGIDATMRCKDQQFPPVNKVSGQMMAKVAARWQELGLSQPGQ